MSQAKFSVGDKVDYVNDFGVFFPDFTILKVEKVDGEIKYFIDPSSPWSSVRKKNLYKPGTYKPENFDLILKNGSTAKFLCYDFYCRKVFLVNYNEKTLTVVLVDGNLYTRNSYEEPCCKISNDLQPDNTFL